MPLWHSLPIALAWHSSTSWTHLNFTCLHNLHALSNWLINIMSHHPPLHLPQFCFSNSTRYNRHFTQPTTLSHKLHLLIFMFWLLNKLHLTVFKILRTGKGFIGTLIVSDWGIGLLKKRSFWDSKGRRDNLGCVIYSLGSSNLAMVVRHQENGEVNRELFCFFIHLSKCPIPHSSNCRNNHSNKGKHQNPPSYWCGLKDCVQRSLYEGDIWEQ